MLTPSLNPSPKTKKRHRFSITGLIFIVVVTLLIFWWIRKGPSLFISKYVIDLAFTGIHEMGHYIFMFFTRNNFMIIIMGCGAELLVPILFLFCCLRVKFPIGVAFCLLLLGIGLRNVGFYAGAILEDNVTYVGITQLPKYPDGDRGYMHRRFGTLGHEAQVRNVFYFLSALCSATGFWWLIQEFKILRPSPKDREIIQELKKSF